jgi:hypothetical protein
MAIEKPIEDDGFDFRIGDFFLLLCIARQFVGGGAVALGINVGRKRYARSIR